MKLSDLIQKYRTENNLSQRQFALSCSLSNGYIAMIERGFNPKTKQPITPTLTAMKKLANGMHMSLSELFEKIDDMYVDISLKNNFISLDDLPTENTVHITRRTGTQKKYILSDGQTDLIEGMLEQMPISNTPNQIPGTIAAVTGENNKSVKKKKPKML